MNRESKHRMRTKALSEATEKCTPGRWLARVPPGERARGALDSYAQGYPKSDSAPEDESRDAVVLQAGAGREGPRVAVAS